jgi:hypothetical protein
MRESVPDVHASRVGARPRGALGYAATPPEHTLKSDWGIGPRDPPRAAYDRLGLQRIPP